MKLTSLTRIAVVLLSAIYYLPSAHAQNVYVTNSTAHPVPITGTVTATVSGTAIPSFTHFRNTGISSTAVQVKATGGSIYGANIINPTGNGVVFLKIYNAPSASVTVGTTVPFKTLGIANNGFFTLSPTTVPFETFSTGITVAVVTGIADNSTTAPAAGIYVEFNYQ